MKNARLHIVALDVPFPADYGGAIDMFYRIKALHELGVELTLHVFEYGRGKQAELEKYATVHYYKRKKSIFHLFSTRPFIVQSRSNNRLLKNVLADDAPILFEGIHTSRYLEHPAIQQRVTLLRSHNIEHEYYHGLKAQSSLLKRLFFALEARKLERYQFILRRATHVLAIKSEDSETLKNHAASVVILPASIPPITGRFTAVKRFALFHGNLSVPENEAAACWLLKTLQPVLNPTFPLVIAGKNPSKKLQVLCKKLSVELIENPTEKALNQLIQEAQIHVLYTEIASGVKLKLLACIHSSGHILVNSKIIPSSSFNEFCVVADDPKSFKIHYLGLQNSRIDNEDFHQRSEFINHHFNTLENCKTILNLIKGTW